MSQPEFLKPCWFAAGMPEVQSVYEQLFSFFLMGRLTSCHLSHIHKYELFLPCHLLPLPCAVAAFVHFICHPSCVCTKELTEPVEHRDGSLLICCYTFSEWPRVIHSRWHYLNSLPLQVHAMATKLSSADWRWEKRKL